ncbi:MAG: hypothetical protein WAL37_04550, partial [Xanthobacteraceae bacterium]
RERLDFTVLGPAVNEASRIAAMCRSVDQPIFLFVLVMLHCMRQLVARNRLAVTSDLSPLLGAERT